MLELNCLTWFVVEFKSVWSKQETRAAVRPLERRCKGTRGEHSSLDLHLSPGSGAGKDERWMLNCSQMRWLHVFKGHSVLEVRLFALLPFLLTYAIFFFCIIKTICLKLIYLRPSLPLLP